MSARDPILVVTSCTATKLPPPPRERRAEDLYAGQQHVRLMRGVRRYRAAGMPAGPLELSIVSAGHGLLTARTQIEAYDATFADLSLGALRARAQALDVPGALRRLLERRFGLAILLLGNSYLQACELDARTALGGPVLVFCSPAFAPRTPRAPGWHPMPLRNADARRFSSGLISLKGELGGRLLTRLADRPGELADLPLERERLLSWLDATPTEPLALV